MRYGEPGLCPRCMSRLEKKVYHYPDGRTEAVLTCPRCGYVETHVYLPLIRPARNPWDRPSRWQKWWPGRDRLKPAGWIKRHRYAVSV